MQSIVKKAKNAVSLEVSSLQVSVSLKSKSLSSMSFFLNFDFSPPRWPSLPMPLPAYNSSLPSPFPPRYTPSGKDHLLPHSSSDYSRSRVGRIPPPSPYPSIFFPPPHRWGEGEKKVVGILSLSHIFPRVWGRGGKMYLFRGKKDFFPSAERKKTETCLF